MNPIAGYEHLTDATRKLFIHVHRKHLSSVSSSEREKYGLGNISEVKWNAQDACVEVKYPDGWWHYRADGKWY